MELIDNRFRIIKKIYTPEIAQTYLTEDIQNENTLVDVKILIQNKYVNNLLFNMFKSEVLVIKNLEHSGIAKYITANEVEENGEKYFYIAYEHINGKTLKELILSDKEFIDNNFFEIAIKLLEILEYLESKKVIHKSISIENIVIDDNLNVYFANFGAIVNKLNSGRAIDPIVGNLDFMPNEQKLGFTTTKSDQYALGIVLFMTIQGVIDITSFKDKKTIDETLASANIDDKLKSFIQIMINNDATERFTSIKHALELLHKIANGEEVEIKIIKKNTNGIEDDYIARQIVKNEMFYADVDNNKYVKNKKSYKLLFYLLLFLVWGYVLYSFLGSLMMNIEKPRHYNNNYRYRKINNGKKKIILKTYKRADIDSKKNTK